MAAELGVSARQLQRRVTEVVGYGPNMLARVLRFRKLQALPAAPLAEMALDAGYADQAQGEALRPLDFSPRPDSRSRRLFSEDQIEAHLDAIESEQREDGGWMFDWLAWSLAPTTDWRGNVTIRALTWLRDNGRLCVGQWRQRESVTKSATNRMR